MGLIRRSHLPPDCHLRHQLLHLSQKCLLPAHEKHHQVREKPFSGHLPPPPGPEPAFTPASYVPCRVAVLDKVTDFLFLLGKLLIVGSVGECCLAAERLLEALCELLSAPMPSMRTVFSGVFLGGGAHFLYPEPSTISISFCFPGILAFFFFTHRIRIVQDTAPPLNYYWVPIVV